MGGCAGKKQMQGNSPSKPTQRGAFGIAAVTPAGRVDLLELRKLYDEESQYMNRKVKACFEVVFAGDAERTVDINMKFISLGESGAMYLTKVLPAFSNLKSLRLWKTKLGVEGAKLLGGVLPQMKSLEVLSLEDNEIKTEGVSYIAKSLPSLPVLRELFLHVNRMGPEGVRALSPAVARKDDLRVLTMDENQIGVAGLRELLVALTLTMKSLTLLGLAFNMLGDDGVRALLPCLSSMTEMKKLTLSGNNVSPQMEAELKRTAPGVDFLF